MIEVEKDVEVDKVIEVEEPKLMSRKMERPNVLEARVYRLKSAFVEHYIYITLSYIVDESGKKRPFEIFINSKDLTKAAEYTVLTRLISAVFRRTDDPTFILDELRNIYDPNGGRFKDGKYVPSIYAEIADVLEEFFHDIGLIKKVKKQKTLVNFALKQDQYGEDLRICPKCHQKTLKVEGGCITCINPECGYSKCE